MKNRTLISYMQNQSGSAWLISKAIRSLGGADNSILSTLDFAEENNKFFVLGSLVLLAGLSAAYGMYLFLGNRCNWLNESCRTGVVKPELGNSYYVN